MQKKYFIIGASAAGIAAARTLRSMDKEAHIICFSDEREQPYNKCFLADYIHQLKSEDQVLTLTAEQAATLHIELRLGVRIKSIASDNKKVMLSDGNEETYDALLIATGTNPIMPPIEGISRYANIFAFHGLKHALDLNAYILAHRPKRAVVIGAGLSGLEVADALCARDIDVTVVEGGAQLLARQVPPAGAEVIERMMISHNVRIYKQTIAKEISGSGTTAEAVMLSDGTVLKTDVIIFAVGLKQNSELARDAGITVCPQGIEVDDHMRTSQLDIYAAGDVIAVRDQLSGVLLANCTWPDAMQQGMHAACAMVGKPKMYPGPTIIATSAFFGLKLFSCGPPLRDDGTYKVIEHAGDDYYHRYVMQNSLLKGFCLVGNTGHYHKLRRALLLKEPFSI